jgi:Uma2 family endonuclease
MAKARPASDLPRTLEEFDRWHAQQPERWEFINGVCVMMAQPINRHSLIKSNVGCALLSRLNDGPYLALISGTEVKSLNLSAIPDVVVARRPIDLDACHIDEPLLIVEVTSPSSERDDTGRKWRGYCLIPSLRHYLIVESEARFATLHTRVGEFEWSERVFEEGTIELDAIDADVTFEEIYEGVEFDPGAEAADA